MLIASYDQWSDLKRQALEEDNPPVPCEECKGMGEIHSLCDCCGSELDEYCEVCEGEGEVYYLDSPNPRTGGELLSRKAYFQEVIDDLKKWCAYSKDDFLSLVGPFVDECRRGH
ncbi:hypothetical protein [Marinobacter sp. NSM]|uniref:hypothetical protein n=1 Tax=Marinobacter sp. NSM TaxID=3458004 RepID=UPI004035FCF2